MFSSFRNRFGIPGVISVIALVFAMLGGAYAANNSSSGDATASAKKAKPKPGKPGPKGPKGDTGPAGVAGPAGAKGDAGARGDTGAAGSNGTNGSNGVSPVGTAFTGNQKGCTEGGVEFQGANTTVACNGKKGTNGTNGSPWTVGGTLPEGETLTGAWSLGQLPAATTAKQYVSLSFPIPLAEGLDAAHVHYIKPNGEEAALDGFTPIEVPPTACGKGIAPDVNAANPQAEPGHLCVYATTSIIFIDPPPGTIDFPLIEPAGNVAGSLLDGVTQPGASTAGARLLFGIVGLDANAVAVGTWAVTAPEG